MDLESLEARTLLSSTLISGVLTVTGTSKANIVSVKKVVSTLQLLDDGIVSAFALNSVSGISFGMAGGNDVVTVAKEVTIPVTIVGDSGNDTLTGGGENDLILGGSGLDSLSGGLGKDFISDDSGSNALAGNDGDDTLKAGAGADTLTGGLGNDLLQSGAGNDLLDGGDGDDTDRGAATPHARPVIDAL